jgi:NADH:ubiquinone oxidoreductase subunit 3 (subunit A)
MQLLHCELTTFMLSVKRNKTSLTPTQKFVMVVLSFSTFSVSILYIYPNALEVSEFKSETK